MKRYYSATVGVWRYRLESGADAVVGAASVFESSAWRWWFGCFWYRAVGCEAQPDGPWALPGLATHGRGRDSDGEGERGWVRGGMYEGRNRAAWPWYALFTLHDAGRTWVPIRSVCYARITTPESTEGIFQYCLLTCTIPKSSLTATSSGGSCMKTAPMSSPPGIYWPYQSNRTSIAERTRNEAR